jgi:hypothetical protein
MFDDDFLRRIREQQEQMRRLLQPYDVSQYASIADQARTAVDQLRASGIFSSLESSTADLRGLIGSTTSVDLAAQNIRDLYEPDSVTRRMAELLGVSSNAALNLPLYDLPRQLQASAAFTEMANLRLHTVDLAHVGSLISAPDLSRARIGKTTALLARRHEALVSTLHTEPKPPAFVAELPSIDLFVQSEAVRAITPHSEGAEESEPKAERLRQSVSENTTDFLERSLYALKPAFREQFLGMRRCAETKGPDSWSQGAASMRKLVKGVLHTVAADELVLPFVTDPKNQLDRNGHPTRATKIAWLCQFIRNEEYRKFVQADLTAALALIDLLDAANHKDEFPEFETQYVTVSLRVEVVIRHLVTLADARKMN